LIFGWVVGFVVGTYLTIAVPSRQWLAFVPVWAASRVVAGEAWVGYGF